MRAPVGHRDRQDTQSIPTPARFVCIYLAHIEGPLAPDVRDGGLGHGEGLGVAVPVPPVAHLDCNVVWVGVNGECVWVV